MSLVEHAERELRIAGIGDSDADFDGELVPVVMECVRAFSGYRHSGGSAALTAALLEKLLRGEPLEPLTGEPREWVDVSCVGGGIRAQNIRCGRVVEYLDGSVVDVEGRVFREPDGSTFTSSQFSATPVSFPYRPDTQIVDVVGEGHRCPTCGAPVSADPAGGRRCAVQCGWTRPPA